MPIEIVSVRDNKREEVRKINSNFAQGGGGVTAMSALSDATTYDVANLNVPTKAALDAKQPAIAAGAGKILAAPATAGGAPVQLTVGTNLSITGGVLNATGGGGSTPLVNDLTTGGTSSALTAEQGKTLKTLADTKADKLTTVTVSTAGNFDLTEAAHNGRRVVATVAGVVFTKTTTWSTGAVGSFLDTDADGTFTLGEGIVVPSNCAAGSATAAGGAVDLVCVDGVLSSKTAAVVDPVAQTVRVFKIPSATNIASGATTEVLLFDQVITGLSALSELELTVRMTGVGSGTKNIRLLVGGAAGDLTGTQVAVGSTTAVTQRQNYGFVVNDDASGVVGVSPNIVSFGSTSTGNPVVAVAGITTGLRVKVTAVKSFGGDTLTFQGGQLRVFA